MDIAYDKIQEGAFPDPNTSPSRTPSPASISSTATEKAPDAATANAATTTTTTTTTPTSSDAPAATDPSPSHPSSHTSRHRPRDSINDDLQEAYKAISSTVWGARLGGFFGSVVKQGESVYREAQQELSLVGGEASKGFRDLRDSFWGAPAEETQTPPEKESRGLDIDPSTDTEEASMTNSSSNVLLRLREEASKRLQVIQKAEDAADEALLRFGSHISDFLKEAITIAPPPEDGDASREAGARSGAAVGGGQQGAVMFESTDAQTGQRVIHSSRFDAQLHMLHTSTDSFLRDPNTDEFGPWKKTFDVDQKTDDISADLLQFPALKALMERLVPDEVAYIPFWQRYYFLRQGIEAAEARRRDLLQAATVEDEVGWDDSDDEAGIVDTPVDTAEEDEEEDDDSAPKKTRTRGVLASANLPRPTSSGSVSTIQPPSDAVAAAATSKDAHDDKTPDSDTSFDLVGTNSAHPSRASMSPEAPTRAQPVDVKAADVKDLAKGAATTKDGKKAEESSSEDDDDDDDDESSDEDSDEEEDSSEEESGDEEDGDSDEDWE